MLAPDPERAPREAPGTRRGSAPSQYRPLAMMQKPVAANQTMATPTNPVKSSHHGLCTIDRIEARHRLMPTTR